MRDNATSTGRFTHYLRNASYDLGVLFAGS